MTAFQSSLILGKFLKLKQMTKIANILSRRNLFCLSQEEKTFLISEFFCCLKRLVYIREAARQQFDGEKGKIDWNTIGFFGLKSNIIQTKVRISPSLASRKFRVRCDVFVLLSLRAWIKRFSSFCAPRNVFRRVSLNTKYLFYFWNLRSLVTLSVFSLNMRENELKIFFFVIN